MKSLSSRTLNTELTEPEASFLVQTDEDLLNLLNVYCCVDGHNDSDYIEQISSGVGFSKSGDLLATEELASSKPKGRVAIQFESSDSELDEEKSFCFLDEEEISVDSVDSVDSDDAEEMEADPNEDQGEESHLLDSDEEMDGEEPYDEGSDEDSDSSPF